MGFILGLLDRVQRNKTYILTALIGPLRYSIYFGY
jgi:hypothetical protein